MAIYDLLARHYDAVTGDSSTEAAFIDGIIKRPHGQDVTLLEVACGTGGIIATLAGRYRVSGLDISPDMLAVAGEKLPEGTPLHLADMSRFKLNTKFDAIICVYHGINHLLDFSAWENFFDCAYRHLMMVACLSSIPTPLAALRRKRAARGWFSDSVRTTST